jgi:hypothetical protein
MAFPLTVITVTLHPGNFQPPSGNGVSISQAEFAIQSTAGGVTLNGNALEVSAKSTLRFLIVGADGHTYVPQDLWFLQTALTNDSDGKFNLRDRGSFGTNGYEMSDHIKQNFRGASWKLLIPITRDDGVVGLIDPEITNTGEETAEESNPPFNRPPGRKGKSAGGAKTARKSAGGKKRSKARKKK